MPMDTGALYGEMVGSWILHLAIPVGIYSMLSRVSEGTPTKSLVITIALLSVLVSFFVQMGFLTILQALSCSGVKNMYSVLAGSLISVGITAFMVALPAVIDGLRLTISQIMITHLPIFTPQELETYTKTVEDAVATVKAAAGGTDTTAAVIEAKKSIKKLGLTHEEYETQTLKETVAAMSYMSAFSGAFGIGVGSFYAGKCNPKSKGE